MISVDDLDDLLFHLFARDLRLEAAEVEVLMTNRFVGDVVVDVEERLLERFLRCGALLRVEPEELLEEAQLQEQRQKRKSAVAVVAVAAAAVGAAVGAAAAAS